MQRAACRKAETPFMRQVRQGFNYGGRAVNYKLQQVVIRSCTA